MQQIIVIFLLCLPIGLSLVSAKFYIFYALALAGIPLGIFMTQRSSFESIAGIGGSAVSLFGLLLGAFIPLIMKPKNWIPHLFKYGLHLFFIIWACFSLFWAHNYIFGFRMLAKIAAPLLLLLAVHASIQKPSDIKTFERAIFFGCFILLFYAITNYIFGYSHDLDTMSFRRKHILTAPYTSPAPFSFHLAYGALLALGKFFQERRKLYLLMFIVFASTVFWAFTRISMAGLLISACLCMYLLNRTKVLKIILPMILCVSFFLSIFTFDFMRARMFKNPEKSTMSSVFSNPQDMTKQIHTSGRRAVWDAALKKFFIDSPLLGSGIGATQEWFYGDIALKRVGVLHSEYIRLLCELGIIGLILFLLSMLAYLFILISIFRNSTRKTGLASKARHYAAIAISSLVFYLITLATDNSLDYVAALGIFVFCSIGLTVSAYSQEQNSLKTN